MSETASPPTARAANSAGALLRAAREQQGLHIAALAAAIKVTPRKLDALENDRWSELPDATFARALAQTVCRTLKIDPRPVLALLPAAGSSSIEPPSRTAHTPFRERSGRDTPGLAGSAIRPMLWAAVVLMVAALVVYFVPESVWRPAAPEAAAPAFPETASVGPSEAASAVLPGVSGVVEIASPGLAEAPPSEPVVVTPVAAAASGVLQLSVSKQSWVQVRAGGGEILLSRDVKPGEQLTFDGAAPFRLIIGNAVATRLVFRGQSVDLAPSVTGNVARLVLQ